MRLRAFEIKGVGPIKLVRVSELADVVVLAGPNGVGKTSINNSLLELARYPQPKPNVWIEVEATDEKEHSQWGKPVLDTRVSIDADLLRGTLQRPQRRNRYQSSFLNFDSDRAIRNVQAYGFGWDIGNPLAEDMSWDIGLTPLFNRYNDVRHSLFRIVEAQRREIADKAFALRGSGASEMHLDFPDVLEPFKEAFWQLLAPKKLLEVNVREQTIYYEYEGRKLHIDTLSSGEKEVVNIVFDFILRGPQHCIVIFDEPELHLHPELSYKLLQTLSRIGAKNQFFFSSHSPEIISASLENTVIFVTPPQDDTQNQAVVVHRDDETHHALQTLGQSIGVISLGKKLVLVEGEESSLDKQTYGAILKSSFPEFVLVPVGGKDTLRSFEDIRNNILNKTIWGVEFYLLCDRDAVNALGKRDLAENPSGRITQLPRYHLENYFLDEDVLVKAFSEMEPEESWLRKVGEIKKKLKDIASSVVPYAVALNVNATIRERVGNISIMPKGASEAKTSDELILLMVGRLQTEGARVANGLDEALVREMVSNEFDRLSAAIAADDPVWKADLPGRAILHKFAATAKIQPGRLKQLYLNAANPLQSFRDIVDIFEKFRAG